MRLGEPFFMARIKVGKRNATVKLPPDSYWRTRYCARGVCAYGNCWCPNGCLEHVDVDE